MMFFLVFGWKNPWLSGIDLTRCSIEQISNKNDLQVMEFVKLFDPPGHARVTMTKSPQDYLKAGVDVGWTFRQFVSLRNIRKRGKRCALMYIYICIRTGSAVYWICRQMIADVNLHEAVSCFSGESSCGAVSDGLHHHVVCHSQAA